MPKNIIDKIWDKHLIQSREAYPDLLYIDRMLIHEVTSAQAFAQMRKRHLKIRNPATILATLDHSIPTSKNREYIEDEAARIQVEQLRKNCKDFGIRIYDFASGHQGIVHVIGPELGFALPGMTLVCGDSHTATHGAFGSLAFGVGTSEVLHVMAGNSILQQRPKTMNVDFKGSMPAGVYTKDVVMALIAEIGIGGASGHIIEYSGADIAKWSMEARMTLCNMSIECGARAGLIAPDERTFEYLKTKLFAPSPEDWETSEQYWRSFISPKDASYDKKISIDISALRPMVSWGINPEHSIAITESLPSIEDLLPEKRSLAQQAYAYTGLKEGQKLLGLGIDWAFIGSCTNGRIEDLRLAAKILAGKKIAPAVTMYIVPGSESVHQQAIDEGLATIFTEAGADFRMPGCSLCLGMNDDKVPAGARCISSSNRNFIGRQGDGSITHLASPATVMASAIAGKITPAYML